MAALTLAYYDIKRLSRRRYLLTCLYLLPLIGALCLLIFPHASMARSLGWVCPLTCALLVAGVVYVQRAVDRATGLLAGFQTLPISDSAMAVAHLVAGVVLFVTQMALFTTILAFG